MLPPTIEKPGASQVSPPRIRTSLRRFRLARRKRTGQQIFENPFDLRFFVRYPMTPGPCPTDCRRKSPMAAMLATADVAQTLNASVLMRMRADIVACRLLPNERLRVEALRERYGMGTSPIREALMRLEAEGLVELEQNKGFRVSEVSSENLLDLMRTRIEI